MALKKVTIALNGQTYTLAKNETTGKYESHIPSDHFPVKVVLKFQEKY